MSAPTPEIRRAQQGDLEQVAALFDAYRQFYRQPADHALALAFIQQRFQHDESVILVAEPRAAGIVAFTQLYPTFCSVSAAPIFVLYDLFVAAHARRRGVGRALMKAAALHASSAGAVRMELATAVTNDAAQRLYESLGWQPDVAFLRYALSLPGS